MNLIDATGLNLIGLGEFGLTLPIRTYRVQGDTRTHLKVDRGPNKFKMIAIENGQRQAPTWIPRHLVSA